MADILHGRYLGKPLNDCIIMDYNKRVLALDFWDRTGNLPRQIEDSPSQLPGRF